MLKEGNIKNSTAFEEQAFANLTKIAKTNKDIINKTNYKERKKKNIGGNRRLTRDRR